MSDVIEEINDIVNEQNAEAAKRESEAKALERLADAVRSGEAVAYEVFVGTPDLQCQKLSWFEVQNASEAEANAAYMAARHKKLLSILDVG